MSVALDPDLIAAPADRRQQILHAAMACFAERGFHQTSMHDISAKARISVGLIYRYFQNKDAVISAMADEHHQQIRELMTNARGSTTLLEALEIFFTAHCCNNSRRLEAAFVVDLFAEGSRNPSVAALVQDVVSSIVACVTELIEDSPEAAQLPAKVTAREAAEIICAMSRGMLMRDALDSPKVTEAEQADRQLTHVRQLWRLLFTHANHRSSN